DFSHAVHLRIHGRCDDLPGGADRRCGAVAPDAYPARGRRRVGGSGGVGFPVGPAGARWLLHQSQLLGTALEIRFVRGEPGSGVAVRWRTAPITAALSW